VYTFGWVLVRRVFQALVRNAAQYRPELRHDSFVVGGQSVAAELGGPRL
jgi:hypothetical protein